jgi:hypothetical protein
MDTEAVIAFLDERGAATLAHPGGTLLAHLRRTAATLERWGEPAPLVLAGLAHAVYGTDGFPTPLASLDERPAVRALLGDEAEAIVHRYCASDRRVTWGGLDADPAPYLDRFTGEGGTIGGDDLRAYWTLTVANELDLVPLLAGGAGVLPFLEPGRHLLGEAAVEALDGAATS